MINIKRDFILTSLNMNNKNNTYNTSIATATVIGSITFYLKLLVILNLLLPMILISTILGKLFPVIRNWLPVMFYRLLIWLLSIKIEYEGNVEYVLGARINDILFRHTYFRFNGSIKIRS